LGHWRAAPWLMQMPPTRIRSESPNNRDKQNAGGTLQPARSRSIVHCKAHLRLAWLWVSCLAEERLGGARQVPAWRWTQARSAATTAPGAFQHTATSVSTGFVLTEIGKDAVAPQDCDGAHLRIELQSPVDEANNWAGATILLDAACSSRNIVVVTLWRCK
jgi:hypothetical protein